MRKRRYPGGSLNEAVQTLRGLISGAAGAQALLPASSANVAPTPPALPPGMTKLKSLDSLHSLSDTELGELHREISEARASTQTELARWEDLGRQLKSALDAALLIITLKSEPGPPKRRRTVAPEEIPGDDHESSGGSEDTGGSEEDSPKQASPVVSVSVSPDPQGATPTGQSKLQAQDTTDKDHSILEVGCQVAFKLPRSAVGEWIHCEITRVITPGVRFEVRDPEPDERGNPGKTYQCRLKDIMPLPLPDQPVRPPPPGSVVLARYPETTAFYKARVTSYQPKRRSYLLRFEGEEDAHKEIEVNDTLVLSMTRARR